MPLCMIHKCTNTATMRVHWSEANVTEDLCDEHRLQAYGNRKGRVTETLLVRDAPNLEQLTGDEDAADRRVHVAHGFMVDGHFVASADVLTLLRSWKCSAEHSIDDDEYTRILNATEVALSLALQAEGLVSRYATAPSALEIGVLADMLAKRIGEIR